MYRYFIGGGGVGGWGFTSHQHCKGYMATFQVYWCMKTSGSFPSIISGTSGHPSRITDVQIGRCIALYEKSEVPGGI